MHAEDDALMRGGAWQLNWLCHAAMSHHLRPKCPNTQQQGRAPFAFMPKAQLRLPLNTPELHPCSQLAARIHTVQHV